MRRIEDLDILTYSNYFEYFGSDEKILEFINRPLSPYALLVRTRVWASVTTKDGRTMDVLPVYQEYGEEYDIGNGLTDYKMYMVCDTPDCVVEEIDEDNVAACTPYPENYVPEGYHPENFPPIGG